MGSDASRGTADWRKSSYSNPDGGDCVEVTDNTPGAVRVRDSKDPAGPAVVVGCSAWAAFVSGLKRSLVVAVAARPSQGP
ncbi:DUF397 domain-containing protein [Streptomyces sp. NPDC021096]|uniref:DUF397 domain-containing protein n=1 Tax=Streptomyces sp. NPDC021096 TaxID=3154792 RepID=UPI0033F2E809